MANYRLLQTAQKRRMFAAVGRSSKSASLEMERAANLSESGGGGDAAADSEPKKVFRLMVSPAPQNFSEEDGSDGDKENSLLEPPSSPSLAPHRSQIRRGSAPCSLLMGSGVRHLQAKPNRELSPGGIRAAAAAASLSRRGNLRRHHSAVGGGQVGCCRGSTALPAATATAAGAGYTEEMLRRMSIDGGGSVGHHYDLLKAQVLFSLTSSSSSSCAGRDPSSLSVINSRRGSLPTDFTASSFAVK